MKKGYNQRLFNNKTLRGQIHLARYYWLQACISKYAPDSTTWLELGCFDGKAINYLPQPITYYEGYDANWEGGLDMAIDGFMSYKNLNFRLCKKIEDFNPQPSSFDCSICMETLEHLHSNEVENYILILAKATQKYCFVSVPNEKGIVLLLKYLIKTFGYRDNSMSYNFKELLLGLLGKVNRIKREEYGHKGFDYAVLIKQLQLYFKVIKVEGIPFHWLPKQLNFTIGIILEKK